MAQERKLIDDLAHVIGISPKWINKYTVVTTFFIIWVTFFDEHNIFAYQRLKGVIHKMETEKVSLNEEIAQALKDKKDLDTDHEKFAREKHLMHRDDEEVIIIETK
jgi:cell division protein DivIC